MSLQPANHQEALERKLANPQKPRKALQRREIVPKRDSASLSGKSLLRTSRASKKASGKKVRRKLLNIKSLHKRVWVQFSIWIRTKDANENGYVQCVTCLAVHLWNSGLIHAGHWIHGRLDFEPRNIAPQCRTCNYHWNTKVNVAYSVYMAKTYGAEIMDELRLLSNTKSNKYTRDELNEMLAHYKQINTENPLVESK